MKILVLTRGCWDKNNNTGNTMDNFFSGIDDIELHNLYFREQIPTDNPCKSIFQISEQQLIKNITRRRPCGKEITDSLNEDNSAEKETKMYNAAKKRNWAILNFVREAIWMVGKWKNKILDEYLEKVKPDIVFMPVYNCWYPHKVLRYVKRKTNAKVVLFHADDNYTLKQFSLSPIYWLYRLNLRKWVRKSEKISSLDYAISDIQRREYSKIFKKDIRILYKGNEFDCMPEIKEPVGIIKMVFTGNISAGRYKSLSIVGKAINKINSNGDKKIELDIYTKTPMTNKMKKSLDIDGVNLKGGVDSNMVLEIQKKADILVHAESFDLKNKLVVRQSFSTKIVDYLHNAKCLFAIGPKDIASIEYLTGIDAAIVASSKKEVEQILNEVLTAPAIIGEYSRKAWECGKRNHQIKEIQSELHNSFKELLSVQ